MGDRDYYLDAENESIREAYKTYLNRLFTLAGLEESEAGKATDAVMRIETELAKNMRSNVELRDIQLHVQPDDDRRSEKRTTTPSTGHSSSHSPESIPSV